MPLVIDSLKTYTGTHAHARTQTHTPAYTKTLILTFRTKAILPG